MRTLKLYLYEIITALALLGIVEFYFLDDQELFSSAKVLILAMYVMIAVATEMMIASRLRPDMWRAFSVNMLVAVVVSVPGWTSLASLKIFGVIAIATLILRLGVATASLKASRVTVNRFTAALVGGTLLAETLTTAYSTIREIYYD